VDSAQEPCGVKLGNPRAAETVDRAHAANRAAADQFAANVLPIVRTIQASGITSLSGIAEALIHGAEPARAGAGLILFDCFQSQTVDLAGQ
jgi:hypothetical protein